MVIKRFLISSLLLLVLSFLSSEGFSPTYIYADVQPEISNYQPDPSTPRSEIPKDSRWRPSDIFSSNEAWETEFQAVQKAIPHMGVYEGHLKKSADVLLQALKEVEDMGNRLTHVYVYASLLFDVDQDIPEHRSMRGRVTAIFPEFNSTLAYMEPELLSIDRNVIDGFMAKNKELKVYEYYFEDMYRTKQYTLSSAEERIMALTGQLSSSPRDIYEAFLNVDIEFPSLVNEMGDTVPLSITNFSRFRNSDVYEIRKQNADKFFSTLRSYENTFAEMINGVAKAHIMTRDSRGYGSCIEAALLPDNISIDTYMMLINTINDNLKHTLHKYVALRRKVLGIEGPLTYANLYNPLIEGVKRPYTYEEGCNLILEALKPIGKEYIGYLSEGLNPANGWIDIYPNKNKRSGAYSQGGLARDVHPFVLHNFDNTLNAVFTTAHEFGHALHSVYSNKYQPTIYAGYTPFLAEIASTANEDLLTRYLLKNIDDVDTKLTLLNNRIEDIRTTIFRQTLFAEFELRFHEYAEAGNPLTADFLNNLYADLIKAYYGPDFVMSENDACEWMYVPHFFYDFYVFTYATGLTSGISIANQISKHGKPAATRYINNMLKGGSSAPPLELLRDAGVDLETPEPIMDMLALFEETIDEFDRVWSEAYGVK